jgi:hypothetical protein
MNPAPALTPPAARRAGSWSATVCGGAFVVAVLVSVILFPPGPNSGDDPTAILGYYTAHHGFDVISDLWSMGATFLLLALLCAAAASNGAGRGLRGRPVLMLAAGAAACALELLASAIELALATTVYRNGDAAVPAAAFAIASKFFCTGLALLALAVAASAATRVTRIGRGAESVSAAALIVGGVGGLLNPAAFAPAILVAELALVAWATAQAVTLRPRQGAGGSPSRRAQVASS